MNLLTGSDSGEVLQNSNKWLIAQYKCNDDLNLIKNPDFYSGISGWTAYSSLIPNINIDVSGVSRKLIVSDIIDEWLVSDYNDNTNFLKITYTPPTELTEYLGDNTLSISYAGVESDSWITINTNTIYRCYIYGMASRDNVKIYIYGNKNGVKTLLATSLSSMSNSKYLYRYVEFNSGSYTQVKIAILLSNPIYDDYILFSNIQLIKSNSASISDYTLFKNDGTAYNYKLECNSIFSDSCISLLGTEDSYLEIKQPFVTNDCITIAFWIKLLSSSFNGKKGIIYSGTENSELKIYINNETGTLCFYLLGDEIDTSTVLSDNMWYHIACTYDQKFINIYINGILIKTSEKTISDFEDVNYSDNNYYSRFGYISPSTENNYISSSWDGETKTISWYTNNKTKVYTINSAADLAGFSYLVNTGTSFIDCTINLNTNIDLNYYKWNPIGYYYSDSNNKPFSGIFNGNGYDIKGLNISTSSVSSLKYALGYDANIALFGYVNGKNSSVKSTITNVNVTGTIKNEIDPSSIISETLYLTAAGIVAKGTDFKISDCKYYGSVSGYSTVGGITADCTNAEIYNCVNYSAVSCINGLCGGIVANLISSKIVNCTNTGEILLNTNVINNSNGGVIGYFYGGTITDGTYYEISNCANKGIVTTTTVDNELINVSTGGIVGQVDNIDAKTNIQGCQNFSEVYGMAYTGGIIGNIDSNENNINIYTSFNLGLVKDTNNLTEYVTDYSGYRNIGGIIGNISAECADYISIYDCLNSGKITNGENAGGIIGINNGKINVYRCINNGNVTQNYNSAGIVCRTYSLTKVSNCINYGYIDLYSAQFITYIGAISAFIKNYNLVIAASNNAYLDSSLSSKANLFDSELSAEYKTKAELLDSSIYKFINNNITNVDYQYTLDYSDTVQKYLLFTFKFPLLTVFIPIVESNITVEKESLTSYAPLSFSICDIRFYDVAISHKFIREFSRAKILHYKCVENETSNANYIPVSDGTYSNINIPVFNSGDSNSAKPPVIEKINNDANIFGTKSYSITFNTGSIVTLLSYDGKSINQYGTRAETDSFTLNKDSNNLTYTFSFYIKGKEADISRLMVFYEIIYTNGSRTQIMPTSALIKTDETLGNDTTGIYTKYKCTFSDFISNAITIRQVFGLYNDANNLGVTDHTIVFDIFAPQLENNATDTSFISGKVLGTLYDISTYNKNLTLDLNDSPMFNADTLSYHFITSKKIVIPAKYIKMQKHFSISMWLKCNTPSDILNSPNRSIISRSSSFFTNGSGWMIGIDPYYNDVIFEVQSRLQTKDVRYYTTYKGTFDWLHITAVYDDGKIYAYKNGKLVASNTDSFSLYPNISDITIGSAFLYDETGTRNTVNDLHDDYIRDIRIYNTALTADDAIDIYQASANSDSNGVLHGFYFNTNNISRDDLTISKNKILAPSIINNNNLNSNIIAYWPLAGNSKNYSDINSSNSLYINNIAVKKGVKNLKSVRFNGTSSYMYSKYAVDLIDYPVFSISFWIKVPEDLNKEMCVFEFGSNASILNSLSIYITVDGYLKINDYGISTNFYTFVKSYTTINNNNWHNIVINIIRCKNITIFIDNKKDSTYSNYAASANTESENSTPEKIWHNEINYNEIINSETIYNNLLYIKRSPSPNFIIQGEDTVIDAITSLLTTDNSLYVYNSDGDNTVKNIVYRMFSLPNSELTCAVINGTDIYAAYYNKDSASSYILKYDTSNTTTDNKVVIANSYYCSVMLLKDNTLYYTDRHKNNGHSIFTRCALDYTTNNVIDLSDSYTRYSITSIISIYTGHFSDGTFVKDSIISPSKYELYYNKINWMTDHPTSTYYVDFEYDYTNYTNYYVKAIDLADSSSEPIVYETNHNNIITSIDIDRTKCVYTTSYDHKLKKTSNTGIVWEYIDNPNTMMPITYPSTEIDTWADAWLYNVSVSTNNDYAVVISRNKKLTKLDLNGNIIWEYTDENGYDFNFVKIINNYIYLAECNDNYFTHDNINTQVSTHNRLVKLDNDSNILWTVEVNSPIINIIPISGSNAFYVIYASGEIEKMNEISIVPYANNIMYIGSHNNKSSYLKGFLQDIKIYNRNLSASEIDLAYNMFKPNINKAIQFDTDNIMYIYGDIDEMD